MTKKEQIIDGLNFCSSAQINLFMRLYSADNMHLEIKEVVNALSVKQVSIALKQIHRTIEKNKNIKQETEIQQDVKQKFEEISLPEAFDVADKDFYEQKNNSIREILGGTGKIDFIFNGKKYVIEWSGFWEKADWYEWHIFGHGFCKKGLRYL
jgi:hypothetical protein